MENEEFDAEAYRHLMTKYEHPGLTIPRIALAYGPFSSVLDVGAPGILGTDRWIEDHGIPHENLHSLDIFQPETNPPNFHLGDAFDGVKIFGAKSFDVVICAEMIEHLERSRGEQLFSVLEEIARKFVILTTPCCFLEQDPAKAPGEAWAKNPYQKHLSGWYPNDFTSRGYQVQLNGGIWENGHISVCGSQILAWKKP